MHIKAEVERHEINGKELTIYFKPIVINIEDNNPKDKLKTNIVWTGYDTMKQQLGKISLNYTVKDNWLLQFDEEYETGIDYVDYSMEDIAKWQQQLIGNLPSNTTGNYPVGFNDNTDFKESTDASLPITHKFYTIPKEYVTQLESLFIISAEEATKALVDMQGDLERTKNLLLNLGYKYK